jgi:hypothetical protein
MVALTSIVPLTEARPVEKTLGVELVEKAQPRNAAAPLSMDWTGHKDFSAVRGESTRPRGMAAMGELQFCLQTYSALERQLQDPGLPGMERGSPTASDFSRRSSLTTPRSSDTASLAASPMSSPIANSPLGSSSHRRQSIPLWDRSLRRRTVHLEEQRADAAEKLMLRRPTQNLTNLRSHDF